MTRQIIWLWGLAFATGISGVLAGAAEVLNESFEAPMVSGRVVTTPTGWKRVYALQNYSAVWNEDTSGATTPHGAQVGAAWTMGGFQSTNVTEVVQPGATYTLTFNVGNCDTDTGNARTDNQYTAEILAGEFPFSTELEDIHLNIEARLTERIGEAGKRLQQTAEAERDDDRLHPRVVGDEVEGRAQILEATTGHRHLVEHDGGEDDPHDREKAEDRALGG